MWTFDRFGYVLLALAAFIVTGIFGYMGIEGWSLLDAVYMTILTFTTVGYDEVRPLSTEGRVFTTILMLGGVGTMLYALTAIVQSIVEEEFLRGFVRRRRMQARLSRQRDHFIVCGFGRVGRAVVDALLAESAPVVVIESDPDAVAIATDLGVPVVQADATDDQSLGRA